MDRVLLVAWRLAGLEVDHARCPNRRLSRRSTPESVRPTRTRRRLPEPFGGVAQPDPNVARPSEGRGGGGGGRDGAGPLLTVRREGAPPHLSRAPNVPPLRPGEGAYPPPGGDG